MGSPGDHFKSPPVSRGARGEFSEIRARGLPPRLHRLSGAGRFRSDHRGPLRSDARASGAARRTGRP
ncbi:hypothetical protein FHR84_003033 [Actinopolyspora biskrensis]|uniref:Uncharacterized protein n=1 Tax=Actinopolyspora biskrensis TaxID=1470178 RepID=A0A852Z348_9ACTN|nr:hypothetical protein [Actinopolyspora biskrensis]